MTPRRSTMRAPRWTALVAVAAIALAGCSLSGDDESDAGATPSESVTTQPSRSPSDTETEPAIERAEIVAVGDLACDPTSPVFDDPEFCRHEEVARLTKRLVAQGADYFMPLGDIQYEDATLEKFNQVYDKWFGGKLLDITEPVPGNHEYYTEGAAGYFDYFGDIAGSPSKPWRTFSPVEGWRVYLLDSNCEFIDGCDPKSPQGKWLAKQLAANDEECAIAAWHHPLHTSGGYNGDEATIERAQPLWDATDAGGVDIVLVGHDHIYDRFAPIGGMTQFLVGTGGKELYEIEGAAPKSQVRFEDRMGVLLLELRSDGRYDFEFIDSSTGKVADSGSGRCINEPST